MEFEFNPDVAGIDVHKEKLTITVLLRKGGKNVKHTWECKTFTEDLQEAGKKIKSFGVTKVAMESSGIYWRPVFNVWDKMGLDITLGNAYHLKNVPGRKTDIKDSEWIAQLHQSGLIRPSFIPEEAFRELRALTRHRTNLVNDITKLKCRIQKTLEDGNIKLASVLSDVFGVAGSQIIEAIINGEKDPYNLAALVKTNVRSSKEVIVKSLHHNLGEYQILIIKQDYESYLYLLSKIDELNQTIDSKMEPYQDKLKILKGIPGISDNLAEVIISEATTQMDKFKDPKTFASWAGVAPGNHESGGKKKESNADKVTHR